MTCDIELEIGASTTHGEFAIRVVRASSGGAPTATMRLDIDALLNSRADLENAVLASAVTGRRVGTPGEQQLRRVGQQLFEALFSGPVAGTYRASLAVAQERGERLRVVLRLTAPQLAALPWEAMFDPETGKYVCRKEPLVRYVPSPYTREPLEAEPPLRLLGLVASPRGMPVLDVASEQDRLSSALAGPIADGLIELHWLQAASWEAVQDALLSDQWHAVHFIGHGFYDSAADQGLIALVGQGNRANLVEAEQLADLLDQANPTPRLVVLNSCSSGESGTEDLFSCTAAALVHSGIHAVAAMQFTVSDDAAINFARGFYTALANGRGVDEATRSGRITMLGAAGTLEWVTPVLYLRGDTTQLFDFKAPQRDDSTEAIVATEIRPFAPQSEEQPPPQPQPGEATDSVTTVERGRHAFARNFAAAARRRIVPLGIAATVVVVAAAGLGIWALAGRQSSTPSTTPTAAAPLVAPPPSDLTTADVELLKLLPTGYSRANCSHANPGQGADAWLICKANPEAGQPFAQFFHFPTVELLTRTYKNNALMFQATSCPGDPPGPDGPFKAADKENKEVGRAACYADNSVTPAVPSVLVTNYEPPVMAILNYGDPGGLDARNYDLRRHGALVQDLPGIDPDEFTPADLDLFDKIDGALYAKTNCRHTAPPSPAVAVLECVANLTTGAPHAAFFAYPNDEVTNTVYDAMVNLVGGKRCGGVPGGSDDAWFHNGERAGRYFCFVDKANFELPGLIAFATEYSSIGAEFLASTPDSPYPVPKNEQELADFFLKNFTK
jgi:hypothetical protein